MGYVHLNASGLYVSQYFMALLSAGIPGPTAEVKEVLRTGV